MGDGFDPRGIQHDVAHDVGRSLRGVAKDAVHRLAHQARGQVEWAVERGDSFVFAQFKSAQLRDIELAGEFAPHERAVMKRFDPRAGDRVDRAVRREDRSETVDRPGARAEDRGQLLLGRVGEIPCSAGGVDERAAVLDKVLQLLLHVPGST